jgi:hypothetical protein
MEQQEQTVNQILNTLHGLVESTKAPPRYFLDNESSISFDLSREYVEKS